MKKYQRNCKARKNVSNKINLLANILDKNYVAILEKKVGWNYHPPVKVGTNRMTLSPLFTAHSPEYTLIEVDQDWIAKGYHSAIYNVNFVF